MEKKLSEVIAEAGGVPPKIMPVDAGHAADAPKPIDDAMVIQALQAIALDMRIMVRCLNGTVDYLKSKLDKDGKVENSI